MTNSVGLADLSVFSKFDVSGPDTKSFMETLGANKTPAVGRIGLIHVLTPAGGVLSEFSTTLFSDTHAYLTSAAAAEEIDLDVLNNHATGFDVEITNKTESLAVIGLMGPNSRQVLQKVADEPLNEDFPWLSAREMVVAGVKLRALRVSYLGELGWELHLPQEKSVEVFLALENAGKIHNIGLYGAYAVNSMRIEKGYRAWGSDLTTERTPLEAGLNYLVKTQGRDFTGKEAMLKRANSDTAWEMVLLEIETSDVDPFYAHKVLQGEKVVGVVTSGSYGHRTQKTFALCYLRDPKARKNLSVSILGKSRPAKILDKPPFDPHNIRLKS